MTCKKHFIKFFEYVHEIALSQLTSHFVLSGHTGHFNNIGNGFLKLVSKSNDVHFTILYPLYTDIYIILYV